MANGKITRKDQVDDKIFDIGKDYAKSIQPAIEANDDWVDSFKAVKAVALEYFNIGKKFKDASGRTEFIKLKQEEAKLRKLSADAVKAEQDALKKSQEVANKLLDAEKKLLDIEAKKQRAKRTSTKLSAEERLERQRQNREEKDEAILKSKTSTLIEILNVKRRRAATIVQDLVAKKKLYNNLSDAEQRELKESTIQFNRYDLAIKKAKETTRQFQENVGNYPKILKIGLSSIKSLIPLIGAGLSLRAAFDFGKEARQLAIEAKGVDFAFERIQKRGENVEAVLLRVKETTRGTLSDLDIKKSIVEFDNFGLSLQEIDTLLEFVTVRATQTGKGFEYLKDSLVEGLSKESKLRIDNLGISTADLNAELKKTPNFVQAVANIAKREIAEAGDILDSAQNSQARWNADLENFKLLVGNSFIKRVSDSMYNFGSAILRAITPTKDLTTEITKEQVELNTLVNRITDVNIENDEREKLVSKLTEEYPFFLKLIKEEKTDNESLSNALREVNDLYIKRIVLQTQQEKIDKLIEKAGAKAFENVNRRIQLERELEKINREQLGDRAVDLTNKSFEERVRLIKEQLQLTAETKKVGSRVVRNEDAVALQRVNTLLTIYNGGLQGSVNLNKALNDEQDLLAQIEGEIGITLAQINELFQINTQRKNDNTNATKQLTEAELKALQAEKRRLLDNKFKLESFNLQQRIDDLKRLAESEEETFDVRRAALEEYSQLEEELAFLTAKNKFDVAKNFSDKEIEALLTKGEVSKDVLKKVTDEELLIIAQYQAQLKNIQRESDNSATDLDVEEFTQKAKIKALAKEKALNEELRLENDYFLKSEGIYAGAEDAVELREKRIAEIKKKYALEALNTQVAAVEELLKSEELSAAKRAQLEAELADLKLQISNLTTDAFIEANDKEVLSTQEKVEQILDISQRLAQALVELADSIFEARIQKIDAEIEANDEKTQRYLENENLSEEQRAEIERKGEERRQQLEKKKREEQRKQAILNKAMAIVDIGIATALGVMQAYAQLGPIAGNFGAALVIALGAIQTAAVIAKPIPKYAKGTKNHPGGLALVGEERPEVITEPGKAPYVVDKPTILNLRSGTNVTPSLDEYKDIMREAAIRQIARNYNNVSNFAENNILNFDDSGMIEELRLTREAILKNRQNIILKTEKTDIPFAIFRAGVINWGN